MFSTHENVQRRGARVRVRTMHKSLSEKQIILAKKHRVLQFVKIGVFFVLLCLIFKVFTTDVINRMPIKQASMRARKKFFKQGIKNCCYVDNSILLKPDGGKKHENEKRKNP